MKSVSNKDYNIEYKQKQYKHLNIKERVKIETMMNDQLEVYGKVNITKIAQKLNRSKSTISREIRRNRFIKKTVTIPEYLNILGVRNNLNFSQILAEGLREKLKIK